MKPRWQHCQVSPNNRLTSDGSSTCRTSHGIGRGFYSRCPLKCWWMVNGLFQKPCQWKGGSTIRRCQNSWESWLFLYFRKSSLFSMVFIIFSSGLGCLPHAHEIFTVPLIRIPKHQAPPKNDECWRPFLTLYLALRIIGPSYRGGLTLLFAGFWDLRTTSDLRSHGS